MLNRQKIAYYERQSANWLATGNKIKEIQGVETDYVKKCYAKSERYLQLANRRKEDGK